MHPKQKEKLVARLNEIARTAIDPVISDKLYASRLVSAEDTTFIMTGEVYQHFIEIGQSVLGLNDWGTKFSEQFIYKAIDKILAKIIKDGSFTKTQLYLDELLAQLSSYSVEFTVYIPVSGLTFSGVDNYEIGNIIFRQATDEFIENLLTRIKGIIDKGTSSEEDKKLFWETQKQFISNCKGKAFAEYRVIAEHGKALERAEGECNRVIDLFWYSVPILYPYEDRISLGIGEEMSFRSRQIPSISSDNYILNSRLVGAPPFPLNDETIKRMEQIGTIDVGRLLKKTPKSLNHFEQQLVRAIHWYAAARSQKEPENEFLDLVICLETLLTPKDRSPIQNAIAEGVALILGIKLQERKRIKAKIKSLYGMRSGVSHGGQKAIADADLQWLRLVAWYLLRWMIQHKAEFESQEKLLDWLEDKKLQ